jgi:hypothetical protein
MLPTVKLPIFWRAKAAAWDSDHAATFWHFEVGLAYRSLRRSLQTDRICKRRNSYCLLLINLAATRNAREVNKSSRRKQENVS